jgi:hypothetical protein
LVESSHTERFPPGVQSVLEALPAGEQAQIVECIKYLREHPEPDGIKIFDIPIYPAMYRSMKCHGYAITFRIENREALLYALVEDG